LFTKQDKINDVQRLVQDWIHNIDHGHAGQNPSAKAMLNAIDKALGVPTSDGDITINEMQSEAFRHAHDTGFHDLPEFGVWRQLALIHSEVSELSESYKHGTFDDPSKHEGLDLDQKSEELADIVIRCGDFAGIMDIDLGTAIQKKQAYNPTRGQLHGNTRN